MNSSQVVSLGTLEADLGLSRVDLLLVIRELGIEPIRKGMRTWIRQDQVSVLYKHLGKSNPHEPLIAEVVPTAVIDDAPLVPLNATHGQEDEDLRKYSKLRLLRERIEVLDLLQESGVELPSQEICSLLDLKRLPPLEKLEDGRDGFQRMGLEFLRIRKDGQRSAWKVRRQKNV